MIYTLIHTVTSNSKICVHPIVCMFCGVYDGGCRRVFGKWVVCEDEVHQKRVVVGVWLRVRGADNQNKRDTFNRK